MNVLSTPARIHAVNHNRLPKHLTIPAMTHELVVIRDGRETQLMAGSLAEIISMRRGFGLSEHRAAELATGVTKGEVTFVLRKRGA